MDQPAKSSTTFKPPRARRQRRTERRQSKKLALRQLEQQQSDEKHLSFTHSSQSCLQDSNLPTTTTTVFSTLKQRLPPLQTAHLTSIFDTPPDSPNNSPPSPSPPREGEGSAPPTPNPLSAFSVPTSSGDPLEIREEIEATPEGATLVGSTNIFSLPTVFSLVPGDSSTAHSEGLAASLSSSSETAPSASTLVFPTYIPLNGEELKKIERAESLPIGIDGDIVPLPQESEQGNVEYKWKLVGKGPERIRNLITQMNYRLTEGLGEAIYQLGVLDNGYPVGLSDQELLESINTIKCMAQQLRCECIVLRVAKGKEGKIAEVLVRRLSDSDLIDIRICVIGNVESGKSTLVGVLTSGRLDDGKGLARMNVFRHRHEVENGRTSSISKQILGFDSEGNVTNNTSSFQSGWAEIVEDSSKVLTFLDLAGHEAYLKTTVMGLMGLSPDYGLVVVTADGGVSGMMKEHLGVSLALRIPIIIVITKIDVAPPAQLQQTIKRLTDILTSDAAKKQVVVVEASLEVSDEQKVIESAKNLTKICPIFPISSKTGLGLQALKLFLFHLPKQKDWSKFAHLPCISTIDDHYTVTGVGTVVAGMVTHGVIRSGESLLLGPDAQGAFKPVIIKSVHVKRSPAKQACTGQAASFALKHVKRVDLRKGMVLMHPSLQPRACVGFEAKIRVLHHPTKISTKSKYEPIVHVGNVRQAALLIARHSSPDSMGTGDRARVAFHFCHRPEYIPLKSRFIFSEGRTRGLGTVTGLIYVDSDEAKEILENMAIRRSGRSPARKGVSASSVSVPVFTALTPPQSSTDEKDQVISNEEMRDDSPSPDTPSPVEGGRKKKNRRQKSTSPPLISKTDSHGKKGGSSFTSDEKSKTEASQNHDEGVLDRKKAEPEAHARECKMKDRNSGSSSPSPLSPPLSSSFMDHTLPTFGLGESSDGLFNLGLSTIFSTRVEEDGDDIEIHEDHQDSALFVSPQPRSPQEIPRNPFSRIPHQQPPLTDKPAEIDKPRRAHPFPFTSPSYLKSLEKHKTTSSSSTGAESGSTGKKRNRKRTRSKKREEEVSIRKKNEFFRTPRGSEQE